MITKDVRTNPMMASCTRWILPIAAMVPGIIYAQTATPTDAEPSSDLMLGEIIVTAQRREERLQDVPVAITAVTGAQLEDAVVTSVTDLAAVVPGLVIANNNGQILPRLRGVVSTATGPGVENSTALYIDGVYMGASIASLLSLTNVERIEALKGPQGTLFGRNSTGGLLHVITRTPTTDPTLELTASYGNYDTLMSTGYVAGGIGNIAADLAVYYKHQGDGFGRNITTGGKAYAVDHDFSSRSKVVFDAGDTTKFTLTGDYSSTENSLNSSSILEGTKGLAPLPPAAYPRTHDTSPNREAYTDGSQFGGSLRWDQGLGDYSLMTLSAYRQSSHARGFDFDATQLPIVFFSTEQPEQQFSQEVQLLSPSEGRFTWVLGAYYYKAKAAFAPVTQFVEGPFPPRFAVPTTVVINGEVSTESIAGFAQGTFKLGENTNLTAGFRHTDETKGINGSQSASLVSTGANVPLPPIPARPDVKISEPSYRVSIDHHFSRDFMLYASFNRGFKSGGFAAAAPGDAGYLPESLDAYELGFKATLLDGLVQVNTAAFHYEYTQIQIQTVATAGTVTTNGPEARINGLDLDFDFLLSKAFRINGGFQFIDDKFTSYPNALISSPLGGVPLSLGSATGNRLPLASKFIGNLSPQYHIDLGGESALDLNLAYIYNSGWYTAADNVIRQDAFNQVNASARYTLPGGKVRVTAWGKNLSNEDSFAFEVALPTGGHNASYAAPRTYGVTLGVQF